LTNSAEVAIDTVPAMSPHFGHVVAIHRETSRGAILAHASGLAVPASGGSAPATTAVPGLTAALTTAFAPLVASLGTSSNLSTHTQSEREHQADVKAVVARYQICWARVDSVTDPVDGSVSEKVFLPTLSAALNDVLTPSKPAKAEASYQESVANHLRSKVRSSLYYDGMTDMDAKSLGIPGISCMREFRYASEPPTHDPEEFKDKLTILHFARTDPGSVAYKTRQEDGRLLTRQHLVGEDKSKLKRKTTDLYYQGMIANADDLKTAIANFWTFSSWAFDDDIVLHPPTLMLALNELVFLLNSPTGRVWAGQHKNMPHVFLHLFLSVQHMLAPFISLANILEYRQAVIKGDPIDIIAYKEAHAFALLQVTKVNNIIHHGDLGVFREPPSIMRIFYPESADTSPPNKRGSQGTPDLSAPVPRKSNPPSGSNNPTPDVDEALCRQQGVMKFSGVGKPPIPKTLFPHHQTKGRMTYLCGNAATVGFACKQGKRNCNFVHVTKSQDLAPADRQKLKTFIETHVELSLARTGQ
jgi:hypothetical protein